MLNEYYYMTENNTMGYGKNCIVLLNGCNGNNDTICHCSQLKKYNAYPNMTMYNLFKDQMDLNLGLYQKSRRKEPFYLVGGIIDLDKFSIVPINDGAKFTVLFEDYNNPEWDSQYYMAATVMFNNQRVVLDEDVFFEDPYTYEDYNVGSDVIYENGAYVVEIPKSYWEDDASGINKEEIINNYTEAFRDAYAQTISKNLGVWSKYGENAEQLFEDCDINEIALVNDDNLEAFLKREGILN